MPVVVLSIVNLCDQSPHDPRTGSEIHFFVAVYAAQAFIRLHTG